MVKPEPKSWWDGNWKWFVPTGCLALLLLSAAGGAGLLFLVFGLIKSSDAYQISLREIRRSPAVVERLGEPVQEGWYVTGNVNVSNDSGTADVAYPVSGPKGSGTVHVEAFKKRGEWTITYLALEMEGDGKRLELVNAKKDRER